MSKIVMELSNPSDDCVRKFLIDRIQFVYNGGDVRIWANGDEDPVFMRFSEDGMSFLYDGEEFSDIFIEPVEETPDQPYEEFDFTKGGDV